MADKKISQLTGATTPLAGTEVLPIVQGGSTVKVAVSDLTAGRAVTASSLTAQKATSAGNTTIDVTNSAAANTSNKSLVRFSPSLDFISYENLAPYVGGYMENAGSLASGLVFGTYTSGSVIERMRISAAGDITASTGNFVVGTAGKGIDFSANANAAGMTSEVLNWYEEGTWTPTFNSFTLGGTQTVHTATYTRIGRLVFLQATFSNSLTQSASGGTSYIDGLPFGASVSGTIMFMNEATAASIGVGEVYAANDRLYPPSFSTAVANDIILMSGCYIV